MGAQGIRRRKQRRDLPDVERMAPGDVDRLFGRFRWGAYTPAGNLERSGFFWRQLKRNGTRGAWAFIAQAKWVFVMFALAIGFIALTFRLAS
jgi:hypothetical protein